MMDSDPSSFQARTISRKNEGQSPDQSASQSQSMAPQHSSALPQGGNPDQKGNQSRGTASFGATNGSRGTHKVTNRSTEIGPPEQQQSSQKAHFQNQKQTTCINQSSNNYSNRSSKSGRFSPNKFGSLPNKHSPGPKFKQGQRPHQHQFRGPNPPPHQATYYTSASQNYSQNPNAVNSSRVSNTSPMQAPMYEKMMDGRQPNNYQPASSGSHPQCQNTAHRENHYQAYHSGNRYPSGSNQHSHNSSFTSGPGGNFGLNEGRSRSREKKLGQGEEELVDEMGGSGTAEQVHTGFTANSNCFQSGEKRNRGHNSKQSIKKNPQIVLQSSQTDSYLGIKNPQAIYKSKLKKQLSSGTVQTAHFRDGPSHRELQNGKRKSSFGVAISQEGAEEYNRGSQEREELLREEQRDGEGQHRRFDYDNEIIGQNKSHLINDQVLEGNQQNLIEFEKEYNSINNVKQQVQVTKQSRFSSGREDGRPMHKGFHEKRSDCDFEVNSRIKDETNFQKPKSISSSHVREDYHSLNDQNQVLHSNKMHTNVNNKQQYSKEDDYRRFTEHNSQQKEEQARGEINNFELEKYPIPDQPAKMSQLQRSKSYNREVHSNLESVLELQQNIDQQQVQNNVIQFNQPNGSLHNQKLKKFNSTCANIDDDKPQASMQTNVKQSFAKDTKLLTLNKSNSQTPVNKSQATKIMLSNPVFVFNIHYMAAPWEVLRLLSQCGQIMHYNMPRRNQNKQGQGKHRGFGYFYFKTSEGQKRALELRNNSLMIHGRNLIIRLRPSENQKQQNKDLYMDPQKYVLSTSIRNSQTNNIKGGQQQINNQKRLKQNYNQSQSMNNQSQWDEIEDEDHGELVSVEQQHDFSLDNRSLSHSPVKKLFEEGHGSFFEDNFGRQMNEGDTSMVEDSKLNDQITQDNVDQSSFNYIKQPKQIAKNNQNAHFEFSKPKNPENQVQMTENDESDQKRARGGNEDTSDIANACVQDDSMKPHIIIEENKQPGKHSMPKLKQQQQNLRQHLEQISSDNKGHYSQDSTLKHRQTGLESKNTSLIQKNSTGGGPGTSESKDLSKSSILDRVISTEQKQQLQAQNLHKNQGSKSGGSGQNANAAYQNQGQKQKVKNLRDYILSVSNNEDQGNNLQRPTDERQPKQLLKIQGNLNNMRGISYSAGQGQDLKQVIKAKDRPESQQQLPNSNESNTASHPMKFKVISQANDSITKSASGGGIQEPSGAKGKGQGHTISVPAASQNHKNLREVIEGASQSPGLAKTVVGADKEVRQDGLDEKMEGRQENNSQEDTTLNNKEVVKEVGTEVEDKDGQVDQMLPETEAINGNGNSVLLYRLKTDKLDSLPHNLDQNIIKQLNESVISDKENQGVTPSDILSRQASESGVAVAIEAIEALQGELMVGKGGLKRPFYHLELGGDIVKDKFKRQKIEAEVEGNGNRDDMDDQDKPNSHIYPFLIPIKKKSILISKKTQQIANRNLSKKMRISDIDEELNQFEELLEQHEFHSDDNKNSKYQGTFHQYARLQQKISRQKEQRTAKFQNKFNEKAKIQSVKSITQQDETHEAIENKAPDCASQLPVSGSVQLKQDATGDGCEVAEKQKVASSEKKEEVDTQDVVMDGDQSGDKVGASANLQKPEVSIPHQQSLIASLHSPSKSSTSIARSKQGIN